MTSNKGGALHILTKDFSYIPTSIKKGIFEEKRFSGSAYKNIINLCEKFITPQNEIMHSAIVNCALDIIEGLRYMKKYMKNAKGYLSKIARYNSASNPFLSKISSSLHEGPPGFFVPASQARTVAALVLMMMANAA